MHRLYSLYAAICCSILSLSVMPTVAQEQQTTSQPNQGCEQLTQAALPKLVSSLNDNNFTALEQALQTLESACGSNEVTQRLRIIGQLVQKQPTTASIRTYLEQGQDNKLMVRLDDAAEENYQNIYLKDKAAYNYVPLRHGVDSLVQVKAAAILGSQMYNLTETEEAIAYLFSDHINTYLMRMQKEKPVTRVQEFQEVEHWKGGWGFTLGGGLYRPLNATNPIFNNQAIFGVSAMSPLSNDWIFDAFFKYRSNKGSRTFEYDLYDQVEYVNSPASYIMGASVGYKFLDLGKFLMIGKGGIAFETVSTGLQEVQYYDYYDPYYGGGGASTRFHNVNTYNLLGGLTVMQHLHRRTFIGANIQYHYSPYNNDRRLLTPTASDYINFELFFRF